MLLAVVQILDDIPDIQTYHEASMQSFHSFCRIALSRSAPSGSKRLLQELILGFLVPDACQGSRSLICAGVEISAGRQIISHIQEDKLRMLVK
jgi:hypothetical protein